eukprot:4576931-Amphidinium_carterae.1
MCRSAVTLHHVAECSTTPTQQADLGIQSLRLQQERSGARPCAHRVCVCDVFHLSVGTGEQDQSQVLLKAWIDSQVPTSHVDKVNVMRCAVVCAES